MSIGLTQTIAVKDIVFDFLSFQEYLFISDFSCQR